MARKKEPLKKQKVAMVPRELGPVLRALSELAAPEMSEPNKVYWSGYAKKQNITLPQILAKYIINDLGLTNLNIKELFEKET